MTTEKASAYVEWEGARLEVSSFRSCEVNVRNEVVEGPSTGTLYNRHLTGRKTVTIRLEVDEAFGDVVTVTALAAKVPA